MPAPRKVRLVKKGHLRIARSVKKGSVLRSATVRKTLRSIRDLR